MKKELTAVFVNGLIIGATCGAAIAFVIMFLSVSYNDNPVKEIVIQPIAKIEQIIKKPVIDRSRHYRQINDSLITIDNYLASDDDNCCRR
jgi:hypothetical protein